MSLVILMDKQEFINKWNNVKEYIESNNINGYTQDIKVYIRNTGFIIATDYEYDNDNYIKFFNDVNREYYVPVGKFSLDDIYDIERYSFLQKLKMWY